MEPVIQNPAEPRRHKIMLVDDNISNLSIGRSMLKEHYEVYPIPSGRKLFDTLGHVTPELILLDILMPEMDGFEVIKILKADPRFQDIPVIFLTSRSDERSELEGLSLGALDYVTKPFSAPLLLQRIKNHLLINTQKRALRMYNDNLEQMVQAKTRQVLELQNSVISTLADMLEYRDDETGGHVFRTQKYLEIMLNKLLETGLYHDELSVIDLDFLVPSALLHDIGKIAVSDAILRKPGPLDKEEFEEMKKHARQGAEAIERIAAKNIEHSFLTCARKIARSHHEKWDGTGYPDGLAGYDIPLEGRLMAIADVYDALISDRPYKKAFPPEEARKIIEDGRGRHFDPILVDIFLEVSADFESVVYEFARSKNGEGVAEEALERVSLGL
ncbi:MAG: response regulator [Deltaproteobacteria bacterium]|jgi:putative two-component system response regulator|nr:response regulator [Deltaproteobacteria bacterium]